MTLKRLIVGVISGLAVLVGASPAAAIHIDVRAQDERACAQQQNSPSCRPAGFVPPGKDGLIGNHNETLVRDTD